METVKRLNPTPTTQRALFLLSRNECAFPGCTQRMVDDVGHYIGKICHIEAANVGGPRFNAAQSNEDRRQFSNLLLMCGTHHDITDDVIKYPVDVMQNLKAEHEGQALSGPSEADIQRFVDFSLLSTAQYPVSFSKLDLTYWDNRSFEEAKKFLDMFLNVPTLSRSFYAHALNNAYMKNLELSFDPREIQVRLNINDQELMTHVAILQRCGLLSDLDNDEYPQIIRYYFTTSDFEDYQISFLCSVKTLFSQSPHMLIDFFESLNFSHLDD
ncbi:MAG: hypothetical protein CL582_14600 [Alteromonadaceae bacterium]|nr:hypothetical protein [Alteromonadaceae bacterium]|tara:strand:+ start:971 stop:1780 length:810 start_codon:yes stop_codon:yes gene_type:complete